ncbi:MAG: hydroxyacid dehydrogenase [Nisaea sp.]|uniref:hydroxyacid dehydrogenase n=1 Tax=Nisaea sp. TaxID=2024842 RepID=UPI001B1FF297|nr:hydroxyacid dehydrogenase [Nisaea sp.]MBO6560394.1 hydroxyacid dehydrogenase [Nisaea sp.]
MLPKVLLIGHLYHPDGEAHLASRADLTVLPKPERAELLEAARTAQAISPRYPNLTDAEVIDAAEDLVIIHTSGRGTDAVDVEAATRRGVVVCNNPGFGKVPVSEHALFMLLGLSRHGREHDAMMRAGKGWQERLQKHNTIRDLQDGVLGIVGLGQIGTEMARKCAAAFNMTVLAYDPYVSEEHAASVGATLCPTLEEVLSRADYVSVHAELNDETRHMFNETTIRQMQPHACLVNTARGKIVSQDALLKALTEGWIRAAALDVYEVEPVGSDNPLLALDNLLLSPHVGGLTQSFMSGSAMAVATKMLQALSGERPEDIVNPEAWEPAKQRAMRLLSGG